MAGVEVGTGELMDSDVQIKDKLAEHVHVSWSAWMQYMRAICTKNADGTITIPEQHVAIWVEHSDLAYTDLQDEQKRIAHIEADKILAIINE